ncbi:MAG TPA: polysaccharide biosynthesis/export family protein [Candidatus Methylacidiphilales bacterium]|jgi:polysaccharide export outer membrane protein|nr:polysaccharide biosynthesis/export family protein [Candidatus Methylacidiphilales bacterium]
MKELRVISIGGIWIVFTALCHGQMSTFPTPPPLAPPSEATNGPSNMAIPLDTEDSGQSPGKNSKDSETTPSPGAAATNPANTTPAASVTAATLSSMAALDDKISLEAGDSISFRVIEDRDQAVTRVVTDTGEVDFPYIGRVKVEGKTCHQVAVEVKRLLEVDYYKQATVIVGLDVIIGDDKQKPRDMAWVVGEVHQEGPEELLKGQPMTVSQMILRAGGFGDFADQRKVKLIHRGSQVPGNRPPDLSNVKDFQIVDVKSVFDGKSADDPVVKSGDYIIVPKNWVNF